LIEINLNRNFVIVTQGNAFTEMFDRLKAENEQRKMEVHGLKDILVRENDHRIRDTEELRMAMELSSQKLGEALERECIEMDQVQKNYTVCFTDLGLDANGGSILGLSEFLLLPQQPHKMCLL
jgi:hypothetical protein